MRRSRLFYAKARFGAATLGATAVEFAIIAPAFMFLLFAAVEGGRMMWTKNALQYAVERAARCAAINKTTCGNAAQTKTYATTMVYGQSLNAAVFTITTAACGNKISASVPFSPTVIPGSVLLTASSCRPT